MTRRAVEPGRVPPRAPDARSVAARGRALVVAMALAAAAAAVAGAADEPQGIDGLIERLIALVRDNYVVAEQVDDVEEVLRRGLANGRYAGLNDAWSLSRALTSDLRSASDDLHFGVRPIPGRPAERGSEAGVERGPAGPAPAEPGAGAVGRLEVLEGNVGYLEVLSFPHPDGGAPAVDKAFERLASTDALILDLRSSRGGRPEMVAYLMSYLFDGDPFVFNRFHWRNSGEVVELSTRAELPGPRYTGRRVFALLSRRTASAPEGLGYHLQQLGRATLVGELTAGAAHTYTLYTFGYLQVAIPTGRPVSPISGGNWQGSGVLPDHEAPARQALTVAHRLAREALGKLPPVAPAGR